MRLSLPTSAFVLAAAVALAWPAPEPPAVPPAPQWPPVPAQARLRFVESLDGLGAAPDEGRGVGALFRKLLGVERGAAGSIENKLVQPTGLFVSSGVLHVADPGRPGVLRYDLARGKGTWLPKGRSGQVLSPVAVAVAKDGKVFVLDSGLRKVFILEADGRVKGELDGDPEGMGQPAGLAVSDDRVFVSDVKRHRVAVYGLEGVFLKSFGRRGSGDGEFNYPTYLWFDRRESQLWVSDSGNFRVQWFDPEGGFLGKLGATGNKPGYLARPRGLARDSEGDVYLLDAAFDALQIFDAKGRLLLFVGQAGPGPGQFSLPGGVFIDEADRLFVADTYNGRVQTFQYLKEARP